MAGERLAQRCAGWGALRESCVLCWRKALLPLLLSISGRAAPQGAQPGEDISSHRRFPPGALTAKWMETRSQNASLRHEGQLGGEKVRTFQSTKAQNFVFSLSIRPTPPAPQAQAQSGSSRAIPSAQTQLAAERRCPLCKFQLRRSCQPFLQTCRPFTAPVPLPLLSEQSSSECSGSPSRAAGSKVQPCPPRSQRLV